MKIFAIGDLHLGESVNKPMDIFGAHWRNHETFLIQNWENLVEEKDIVLIPGDISWAMRLEGAAQDLGRLENLPGKKICIRGNHDYWWDRPGKLNARYEKLYFLQNKAYLIEKKAICGTRGWTCPNPFNFTEQDQKIVERELIRLKLSLEDGLKKGAEEIIVMLHYPPTYNQEITSPFCELLKNYPVTHVVYGHLHDKISWGNALQGDKEGIQYKLVAADYLNFIPLLIQ